jgi:apolipoprotein D and lipocalin family protein
MKLKSLTLFGIFSTLVMSCAHSYNQTVDYVERDRFMGTWYVVAGRFTILEKDVFNSIEKYTWNEKKKQIDIDFSYNQGSLTGPVKKIPQTAWIVNEKTNATWKVSPFWPLKFTYLVVALDPDYQWAAIGVPNQNYLWIMARDPQFSQQKINDVLALLKGINYPTEDLVFVKHSKTK